MTRLLVLLSIASLMLPMTVSGPAIAQDSFQVAQQQKPRTLFDLLFGPDEKKPVQQRAPTRRTTGGGSGGQNTPAPRQQAVLPPANPDVAKVENATRLAVFGDSLAVDLAKALERAYADDPNLMVIPGGVGSSGFVRDDFYDWNAALRDEIARNSFDIAVVIIGINDRQPLRENGQSYKPLTDEWKAAYSSRVSAFLEQLRAAGKPVVWVGLPPMQAPSYSTAISQISSLQKLSVFSGGAEFVDIYDRFIDDAGDYTSYGPDLNGDNVQMRKSDGIHFSNAGSDKLAFYVAQSLKTIYRGGAVTVAITDALAGTDAAALQRPPFQGLGQIRLLEVASAVTPLNDTPAKALDLVLTTPMMGIDTGFDLMDMLNAPSGRADAFGVGISPEAVPRRVTGGTP